ncbi:MAG: hypothetical protein AAFU71_03800 [Cyanobacteria bacterium J06632_22]
MRFGIACFVILFLGTELYHWLMGLGQFELSLPLTILAGGGLVIASNLPRPTSQSTAGPDTVAEPPTASTPPHRSEIRPDTISFRISPPFQSK